MTQWEEAQREVLCSIKPLKEEEVEVFSALKRVMAQEVVAREAIPARDQAAVDGFVLRSSDVERASPENPIRLKVVGVIPAGKGFTKGLKRGEAARIMTGGFIPEGANTILKREESRVEGEWLLIGAPASPEDYIIRAGAEFRPGERVIEKGVLLGPAEIGVLAHLGYTHVMVFRRPVVAILSIGDELVELEGEKRPWYSLGAQVYEAGAIPLPLGIARDRIGEIKARMQEGLMADLLITTGGTGKGEYDLVKRALKNIGAEVKFQGLALRPGRTTAFALKSNKPIFCLPGRPPAAFVAFEVLIRPAILTMMGNQRPFRPSLWAVAKGEIQIRPGPPKFLPARLFYKGDELIILPVEEGQGESLRSLAQADGLALIPEGTSKIKAGEKVQVFLTKNQ